MSLPIAIDLSRLLLAPLSRTPRGIDRVDLGYARHFFETWSGKCVGTVPTPWGIRWVGRRRALRVVSVVEELWREVDDPMKDQVFLRVKNRIYGSAEPIAVSSRSGAETVAGFWSLLRDVGISPGRSVVKNLNVGSVYLNTGQLGLGVTPLLSWLARRPDVKPVFMLHDVIPLDHAEYVTPRAQAYYAKMVSAAAAYATGIVTTTEAASKGVRRELERSGSGHISVHAVPLPVGDVFLRPKPIESSLGSMPYFVCCGSIEPRKNHILLLNVWRELSRTMGSSTPKLVIVGSRNRADRTTIDMLERCEVLRPHVIEAAGLSTPGLKLLLEGARGLLMPSFAEGFGLPVIEALSCGTPVVASDIPAHREVAGRFADFISPIDGAEWLHAIETLSKREEAFQERRRRLTSYRPWTWRDYFNQLEPFINSVPARNVAELPGPAPDALASRVRAA